MDGIAQRPPLSDHLLDQWLYGRFVFLQDRFDLGFLVIAQPEGGPAMFEWPADAGNIVCIGMGEIGKEASHRGGGNDTRPDQCFGMCFHLYVNSLHQP